ncbi:CIC11C00000004083 [Sungouiella intermedia]|uniref:CIC11C00000004083 n=1 Tax=Sungouiella intermedia TaxID=45354 RepID=A0A1L0D787_9ASCO|nr:CIC11C00000004083 [[Candida] intermedia]SGZ52388.1 CIC11C00000005613 [[Candida] intermedia]
MAKHHDHPKFQCHSNTSPLRFISANHWLISPNWLVHNAPTSLAGCGASFGRSSPHPQPSLQAVKPNLW